MRAWKSLLLMISSIVFIGLPVCSPVYAKDYLIPKNSQERQVALVESTSMQINNQGQRAFTTTDNNVLEKESVTPNIYHHVAKSKRVPASLLYAIILAESQSYIREIEATEPWPWTVNHAGKPHYFQNKIDAVIFVRGLLNDKQTNFDVGLGQLNWKFHGQRFSSIADAFDPLTNLSAAATFLRKQFERDQCVGWKGAIGCYHRPNQKENHHRYRAQKYTKRVLLIWQDLDKKGK